MPILENKDNNLHRLTSTTNKKKANILKRLDTKCKGYFFLNLLVAASLVAS